MEDRAQGEQASLPLQEGESPATTGIEAPVTSKHLNANTLMPAIALGAEELTDGLSVQGRSLNQERLLYSYPNQPFVEFVCRGLRQGFCHLANTHYGE